MNARTFRSWTAILILMPLIASAEPKSCPEICSLAATNGRDFDQEITSCPTASCHQASGQCSPSGLPCDDYAHQKGCKSSPHEFADLESNRGIDLEAVWHASTFIYLPSFIEIPLSVPTSSLSFPQSQFASGYNRPEHPGTVMRV